MVVPATLASTTQNIGCLSIMTPSKMGKTKNPIFYSVSWSHAEMPSLPFSVRDYLKMLELTFKQESLKIFLSENRGFSIKIHTFLKLSLNSEVNISDSRILMLTSQSHVNPCRQINVSLLKLKRPTAQNCQRSKDCHEG